MEAAKVYEAVGTQEEVGDQGCDGVQLGCDDTAEREREKERGIN